MGREKHEINFNNTSYLSIRNDEILDALFPGFQTNAGKRRLEIETAIILAHIVLCEFIIISCLQFFLEKTKESDQQLAKELADKIHTDQATLQLILQLQEEKRLLEFLYLQISVEFTNLKNILYEKINQADIVIEKLIKIITQKTENITQLKNEINQIDYEIRDIFTKNYEELLTQPTFSVEFNAGSTSFSIPDSPLNIDIAEIAREILSGLRNQRLSTEHIELYERNRVETYVENLLKKNDYQNNMEEFKKMPAYAELINTILEHLHASLQESDLQIIKEKTSIKAAKIEEKNNLINEVENFETILKQAEKTKFDLQNLVKEVEYQENVLKNITSIKDVKFADTIIKSLGESSNKPSTFSSQNFYGLFPAKPKQSEKPTQKDDIGHRFKS